MTQTYLLVTPCRNEAEYMRRTLDSVVAQDQTPDLWVIVDDGSTDETPAILAEYAARNPWIRVLTKPDRGKRAVGPGVIEAFYFGLNQVEWQGSELETGQGTGWQGFDYLCKLDLDLDLPKGYFSGLIARMQANPRIGSCSGKPYFKDAAGQMVSEKCGDEMSVGMTKFYRTTCFRDIGGFVQEVMWDAIDCHKSRQLGWIACSWDVPELRFEHLRPMGSSQKGIFTGRMRHGFGQYYMGSDFFYFTATCLFRMAHPPFILGGFATWWGYVKAWAQGTPHQQDAALVAQIRRYQRRALILGKTRANAEVEDAHAQMWQAYLARAS